MIRFNYRFFDKVLEINRMNIITLENPVVFSNLVSCLYDYDESNDISIFYANQKQLTSRDIVLITDMINFNLNSNRILKLIYTDIIDQLNDSPEVKSEIEHLIIKIESLIMNEMINHELELTISTPEFPDIFKAYQVKIDFKSKNIFDKIIEIVKLISYLPKKKLLIFCNSLSYFTEEQIKILRENISLYEVDALFIEPRKVKNSEQYILDNDYFFYKNMV